MSVTIPLWVFWLVPILIGLALVVFTPDESGHMFSLPGPGAFLGCGLIVATILVAIGFYASRLFR